MNKWSSLTAIVEQGPLTPTVSVKKIYFTRLCSENLLAFLLQYIGLMMSPPSLQPAPLWFASGTALAFIYMRGAYILPGVGLGTFLVYYFAKMGAVFSLCCAGLFILQIFLLFYLGRRFIGPALLFYQRKQFYKFLVLCTLCTAVTSCTLVAFFTTHFYIKHPVLLNLQWWLGNLMGTLVLSFAMTTFDGYFAEIRSSKSFRWNVLVAFVFLFMLSLTIVLSGLLLTAMVAGLAVFLLILYISKQYGWCGAVFSLFWVSFIYNLAASFSAPLFVLHSPQQLLYWQGGMLVALLVNLSYSIKHTKV